MRFVCSARSIARASTRNFCMAGQVYTLHPLPKFGVEARGIDLKQPVIEQSVIDAIRADVTRHRLVIFKDQGVIPGERLVEIGRWLGKELESTFYKHPKSPHPDVFRVSNDEQEGCTGVGRTGWHVDGSFQTAPFSHAIYHIVNVPTRGTTSFAPLKEVVAGLPGAQRCKWERLWMASDRRSASVKPLVYSHPVTGDDTLCVHTGMIETFVVDKGREGERRTSSQETRELLAELEGVFRTSDLVYHHKWEAGDLILSDNAALAHEASADTQLPPAQVGLRVMHRVTTAGPERPPTKNYALDEEGRRVT